MNYIHLQLVITALLTACACALPGTFLVLRGTSFMSDALGHAILLGIVLSFFVLHQLHHPLMFVGATIVGLITVALIELLIKTQRTHQDAAIGIVFPFLFSVAVILINLFANSIHLDIDAVLLGELAFTPFYQIQIANVFYGSYAMWIMGIILILNIIIIATNFKAFTIVNFDQNFASLLKFKPHLIHYLIMMMTCWTIVGAFECAGAILIVAFMITVPATAQLIAHRLTHMLILSTLFGMIGAMSGCIIAHVCNVSIAGSIAAMNGIIFFIIFLLRTKITSQLC